MHRILLLDCLISKKSIEQDSKTAGAICTATQVRHQRPNRTSVDFKFDVNPTHIMLRHIKTQANFKFREDQTSHSSHKPKSFLLLTDLFRIRIPHRFSHWFRKGIPRIQKTVGEKQVATGTEFNNCYPLCSLRHTLISQLTEPHSESVAVDITLM